MMNKKQMKELMETLIELQQTCSPIVLSIGQVDAENHVLKNTVLISDACPLVTERLVELGYYLTITPKGVEVDIIRELKA